MEINIDLHNLIFHHFRPQPLPQSNERNRRAVEFLGRSGLPQLPATGTYPGSIMVILDQVVEYMRVKTMIFLVMNHFILE